MSQIEINNNINNVNVENTINTVDVDNSNGNVVIVPQEIVTIVEINTPGPQGPPGPSGSFSDTGSYVTTSSFNAFTSSYNTGSFTGSFTGSLLGTASFATQALSASFAVSSSRAISSSFAISASWAENSPPSTLQQVTDAGNETTNDVIVKNSEDKLSLQPGKIRFDDIDQGGITILRFEHTDALDQEVFIRGLGGTMALLSDIPDTGSLVTTSSFNAFTSSYNTGSFTGSFTGSLFGTASFAVSSSRAISSSFATQALSASFAVSSSRAISSSFATQALSASFAVSSSRAISSSFATTASFVTTAQTASFVTGSNVFGPFGSNSIISASFAISSSRALTASYADNTSGISSSITNNVDNYLLTATGGSTINGESNLTFDGILLSLGKEEAGRFQQGGTTDAYGTGSHAEGQSTGANGIFSHAEGRKTIANGNYSHTEGYETISSGAYQHVQGQFNISSSAQSAFIIGNGIDNENRSNLVFASGSEFQVTGSVIATQGFTTNWGTDATRTALFGVDYPAGVNTRQILFNDISNNGFTYESQSIGLLANVEEGFGVALGGDPNGTPVSSIISTNLNSSKIENIAGVNFGKIETYPSQITLATNNGAYQQEIQLKSDNIQNVVINNGTSEENTLTIQTNRTYTTKYIETDEGFIGSYLQAPSITGSLFGTASYALNSLSASYALTASYSNFALTASNSQNAQDILIYVKNMSGAQIDKGLVVRISGATGDNALISTASYESDPVSANTLGITTQNIPNDSFGYVMTEGTLLGINTDAFTAGQLLYLGPTGSIIGTAPVAPLHNVRLGQVLRVQQNNGSMYVRIDNGYELGELHDVVDNTTTSSFGDLLIKSGSVWTNSKQLTGSYGLTGSLQATSFTGSLYGTGSIYLFKDILSTGSIDYTLQQQDTGRILQFTSSAATTITIPPNLQVGSRFEGKQLGTGQLSFVTGSGVTLRTAATENAKTAERYSVFAIDWIGAEEYMLYGRLEQA